MASNHTDIAKLRQIVKVVALFGEHYWTPYGLRSRGDFLRADGWRGALEYFLFNYAFERLGGFKRYAKAARDVVHEYDHEYPEDDFEICVWDEFCARIGAGADGKGANKKVNPLAPSSRSVDSIQTLVRGMEDHEYNLFSWIESQVRRGQAIRVYSALHRVRGIGDKIVAFFLRDVAIALGIEESNLTPRECFQPIDVWTRRGAEAWAMSFPAVSPNDHVELIVHASRIAGVSPLIVNTGLWYLGVTAAESAVEFQSFLSDTRQLDQTLERLQRRSEALADVCNQGCRELDD